MFFMRGLLLFISMIFFAGSMYFFYHPEFLTPTDEQTITGKVVDARPLFEKIADSIHKPASVEDMIQMTPVVLLFLSVVCAFASVFIHYGER